MVEISTPLSFWMQIASLCFTLSGIHTDLLIIRFFLFLAYVMLFANAVLGSPLWPNTTNPGYIPIDSLFWSIAGLYVHGSSMLCLILDELPVSLSEDESALWRLFYRTGGLSARLYKSIVSPYVEVVSFKAGEVIPTEDFFYILYKGHVDLQFFQGGDLKGERAAIHSGDMFDMKYLGMFAEDHVFVNHTISCTSQSASVLFRFSRADMKKIAQHHLVKSVWQSLLVNNLSKILEKYLEDQKQASNQHYYDDTDLIFRPLEDWEFPKSESAGSGTALKNPLRHFWISLRRQFSPPWPMGQHLSGIRQTALPAPVNPPSLDPQRFSPMHGSTRGFKKIRFSMSCSRQNSGVDEDSEKQVDLEHQ
jgi:hypothetical protein